MSRPATSLFPVNFLTGMSDGLFLPFAGGLIALSMSEGSGVLCFAVAAGLSIAGALVYGFARYFGEREEIHHHHPGLSDKEADKEQALMQAIGIAPELTEDIRPQLEAERSLWLKEVEEHGMGWEQPDRKRALHAGLHTALGFLTGGLCAGFYAYLLAGDTFFTAAILFLITAGMLGYARSRVTGKAPGKQMLVQLAKAFVVVGCALLLALLIHAGKHPWAGIMFDPAH